MNLHSAALYCYYFGYPLLPKGANRRSTKIEMLNWKLSKHGTGSMEGQGKGELDLCLSHPLFKLAVPKMRICSYDRVH